MPRRMAPGCSQASATSSICLAPNPPFNAQPGWATVAIRDDGDGFDTAGLAPENLGLKIMRERAETIGAQLSIDSQPGLGTQVELVWRAERGDVTV